MSNIKLFIITFLVIYPIVLLFYYGYQFIIYLKYKREAMTYAKLTATFSAMSLYNIVESTEKIDNKNNINTRTRYLIRSKHGFYIIDLLSNVSVGNDIAELELKSTKLDISLCNLRAKSEEDSKDLIFSIYNNLRGKETKVIRSKYKKIKNLYKDIDKGNYKIIAENKEFVTDEWRRYV